MSGSFACGFRTDLYFADVAVNTTLRGVNEMLGVGWLLHQPSHALDDTSNQVFDRVLVIVIPSHILESV